MRKGPKFNKRKCLRCKYHTHMSQGYSVRVGHRSIHVCCNFATVTGITCLKPEPGHRTSDLRGEDYDDCKLFVEGEPERIREL
jgi:hypothetical protein